MCFNRVLTAGGMSSAMVHRKTMRLTGTHPANHNWECPLFGCRLAGILAGAPGCPVWLGCAGSGGLLLRRYRLGRDL